jgi:hypothetical protein
VNAGELRLVRPVRPLLTSTSRASPREVRVNGLRTEAT